MNNNAKRKCYEIVWIAVQVVILYIFSTCYGFKGKSNTFKIIYTLFFLTITIYLWLDKENFFKLLIDKFFYEIRKRSCGFIKKLHLKFKNKITIDYLEPFSVLSLIVKLILSYFFNLHVKKILDVVCVLNLSVEKIVNDNLEREFIRYCLKCVKLVIALVWGISEVVYLYFSVLILIKLVFGSDLFNVSSAIVIFYIYIWISMSSIRNRQENFFISVIILVAIIIIQISDFENFIMPMIVLVVIPIINWYYSETRQLILDEENYKKPDRELKKKWAKKKSVTVFFSISFTIVVIIKKLLPAHIKKYILETSGEFYNNNSIKKLFELEDLKSSTLLSLATILIFIITWFCIPKVLKIISNISVWCEKYKEKLRER